MVTQELTLRGGKFYAFDSTIIRNDASTYSDPCAPGEDCLTVVGNGSWDIAHTFDPSSRGERLGREPNTLVQHTQHTGGIWMAELATIQLVQPVGARSTKGNMIN
jgi:hypothetical protein